MKQQWEKLIVILEEMLALYQAILVLSKEKRAILVAADGAKLDQITRREEMLILQAGKLESQRALLINDLGTKLGLSPADITLEQVVGKADAEIASRLNNIDSEFNKVLKELVPLNKVNTELIQHALSFIKYNINMLAQNGTGPNYAAKGTAGDKVATPARAIFDQKI